MADQIRSADLLVRTALASPETLERLKQRPEETLRALAKDATEVLPRSLPNPSAGITSVIWLMIVAAFVAVMLFSAFTLGSNVATKLDPEATYVTNAETTLTLFTTVVAFLAGLLSPSPVK